MTRPPSFRHGECPFPHAFRFGGGGQTGPGVASTPITAASPPVTSSSAEVVQQQQDLRRQALKKRGFASTYKAGDTGGWYPGTTTPSSPKLPQGAGVSPAGNLGGTT